MPPLPSQKAQPALGNSQDKATAKEQLEREVAAQARDKDKDKDKDTEKEKLSREGEGSPVTAVTDNGHSTVCSSGGITSNNTRGSLPSWAAFRRAEQW